MNTVRKIFASVVAVATIISISGFGAFSVNAAAVDGQLIKMNGLSTVYYYKGGKRFVFPNEKTFMTWYRDFNSVTVISQSELESYPLGGNVTYRPGVQLVKITTMNTVYAVGYNRTLHSIVSEANAISLWGANWAKMVQDVPDAFFTNYVVGSPLTAGMYPEGQLVKKSNSPNVYYYDGSTYRPFASEAAFTANRFSFAHVATAPDSMTLTPVGSTISGVDANLIDVSGGASGSVSTGTGLSVALAADTPASASVPKGASRVTYTKFNVTASNDGDIVLQSVVVNRSGVGTPADFENVYLYDGMTRLTTGRSINSSTNTATFNNLNLTVARGTTKTLSIVADMLSTGTGSGSSSLGISAASSITAGGATVSGTFPVSGNVMSMTNVSAGKVTIDGLAGMSNPRAGDMQAKVSTFRIDADAVEDQKIQGITLYNTGSVQADKLSNFNLKQAGTTVATATGMASNGLIVLNFTTPFALDRGASRTFDLYADIAGTTLNSQTIDIYLDNSADLFSIGQTYGFGAQVDRTAFDEAGDAQTLTVQAAQVTLAFQGPSVQDIATQQQDVEVFRFTITAQSNIEIRNTDLQITADAGGGIGLVDGGAAMYKDIKFVDVASNTTVAGPKDVATGGSDTDQELVYTDVWNVNAGQTRTIKVTVDLGTFTPVAAETVKFSLNTFDSGDIRNLDNNQTIDPTTNVVPSSTIVGNTHRVKSGSLTLSLAATPSVQTYVHGTVGAQMVGVNMVAGTGKDVKVNSVKLTANGADDCATETDCVLNVKLWDGATQVGQTKSLASAADPTVTFDNLNYTITKGTTKTLIATVDLNTITFTAGADTLEFGIAVATDVTAQDVDGNTVTPTGTVDGPDHTISAAGTLSVALAPDDLETEGRIILTGKTDEVLGKFKFTAVNESLKLTRVTIELPANTADEVNSVSLWNGATKVTGDVAVTNAATPYAMFNSFTTDVVVPKDGSATLTVKANTNTTSGGADSGATITATLATDAATDTQFEARGVSSNTVLDDDDISQTAARDMVLRKTKMTLTENALPATTIINGTEQEVYNFTIAADNNEDVAIKQLIFDVTLNDNVGTDDTLTLGSFKLYRGSTNLTGLVDIHALAGTSIEAANLAEGTSQAIVTFASEEVIAKGTSNTYSLRATSGGYVTPADDDTITITLKTDATAQTATHVYLVDLDTTAAQQTASLGLQDASAVTGTEGASPTLAANMNIIWSDNSVVPHDYDLVDSALAGTDSTSDGSWINGYLLKNMPFSGRTMNN
jgi:hypothetical protein